MANVNETVVRYIAAWNERDPKRRRELVAATWAEEGSYIDAHRHGKGHSAIDAMLATTQAQFNTVGCFSIVLGSLCPSFGCHAHVVTIENVSPDITE